MTIITANSELLTVAGMLASLGVSGGTVSATNNIAPTTNLVGWWDASTTAYMKNAGVAITGWSNTVSTLVDRSAAANDATTPSGRAVPHQAGVLGGLYSPMTPAQYYTPTHPFIATTSKVTATNVAVGTGGSLTVLLVWSRAQRPMNAQTVQSTATVPLLQVGGTTVLSMTSVGDGSDGITVLNGTTKYGTLELRHTHVLRVVFSGGSMDVYLDGSKIINAMSTGITLGSTTSLTFLQGAQCIFHEAAAWNAALGTSDLASLYSYIQRWPLGPRRAIYGVAVGQSNASYLLTTGGDSLSPTVNALVAYWTGCISSNLLFGAGQVQDPISGKQTIFSGTGLYNGTSSYFLDNSGGGSPSTWPLGTNGTKMMAALDALTADQKANLRYIAWYWSENDSASIIPSTKATFSLALQRAFALVRAQVGMTAAQLPILVISALPFGTTDAAAQTHREVMADLVADPTMNVWMLQSQSGDAIGRGDTWTTGVESGPGESAHRDSTGNVTFVQRWGIPISRAALAANATLGTTDVITSIPSSVPNTGGPSVVSAVYESGTNSILVTVSHDGGNDLIVPLFAANGVGWMLMDGLNSTTSRSMTNIGALISATSCARVSATQLRIVLASTPSYPGKALLYYGFGKGVNSSGYATIGRGNAVTDNFSQVILTDGWHIGEDIGATNQPNFPLRTTPYGIALS